MIEIEAKFTVPDRDTFDRLCGLETLAGYRLMSAGVKQVQDHYLDTEGRAFLRAGYACRLRQKDVGATATLKGLKSADAESGIHRRDEYEVEADEPDPTTWTEGPARDLALQVSDGEPLRELFALHQERHLRQVHDGSAGDSPPLAEMSIDVVTAAGGDYYELEIELKGTGTPADLQTLADELRTAWELQPQTRSKFERGLEKLDKETQPVEGKLTGDEQAALQSWAELGSDPLKRRARIILLDADGLSTTAVAAEVGLSQRQVRRWRAAFRDKRMGIFPEAETPRPEPVAKTPPEPETPKPKSPGAKIKTAPFPLPKLASPGILPTDPMSEAGRKTFWFHLVRMLKHEPGTRRGKDIEELHDMRVATRRMRAATRVFGDFFEPKAIRPFEKGIRRVTRALGPVRDLDVFEEKAGHYLKTLPAEARDGLHPLLKTWRGQRKAARADMLAFLDSRRYRAFVREFADFVQAEGEGALLIPHGQPVPYQVRHVAPRMIYTRYETVRAYEPILTDAPIETLHALRIDFKYLRYTLEFLREVLGPEGEAVIKEVKKMQDHLGDLNDAEVAIGLLNEFLRNWDDAQAGVPLSQRRSVEGVVTYLAARHAEKHQLLINFPQTWENFNRDETRRWLALAVAAL